MDKKDIKIDIKESNRILLEDAKRLIGVIGKGWFRTVELVKESTFSHEQVEEAIEKLTVFGFIQTESIDGKWRHRVVLPIEDRTIILENQKTYLQEQIRNSIDRIKLIDMITEEINKKPIIEEIKKPGIEVVSGMADVKKEIQELNRAREDYE